MSVRGATHHVDFSVTDLTRSRPFYQAVLGFMGYAAGEDYGARGTDYDLRTPASFCSIGIRVSKGANAARTHDRYAPGLHHIAWNADSRADVDALYALLQRIDATILDSPADYSHIPQYGEGYYAVFFADPDGLKLEYVFKP